MSRSARNDPAPGRMLRSHLALAAWVVLAAALFSLFILLGNWQVRRLHWKLGLIHDVATRVTASPVPAPGRAQWPQIASGHLQYLHVTLRGRFLGGPQTLVHGSSEDGYGFWVIAPLRTDSGFIVLVNRGYIPGTLPGTAAYARAVPPAGNVSLTGLLRFSEPVGGFLRPNQPAKSQWYSRDVPAMAKARALPSSEVAPYFVDVDANAEPTDSDAWPRAGLTVIQFPNNHLGYLITWYLMALMVAAAALYMGAREYRLRREIRSESGGAGKGR